MIALGKQARPLSKRALTAQLKIQRREDAVIARQKPVLNPREYESFLRTGRLDTLGTGRR